ncbi:hypothetical protein C8R44DRAFT_881614 [Mycena epipterygia]|nr:hypothetical protein C8R44DRAFT_881614 [Mycena epipterygia]
MEPASNQLAQELVDHIIGFLRDSPRDLSTCALVARSWVFVAQSHVFRNASFKSESTPLENEYRLARFQETLSTSPHLIRLVRQLHIDLYEVSTELFVTICNLPFTHLEEIRVLYPPPSPLALQQLLSLPSLLRLEMRGGRLEPQIWDRCFSLRHLNLHYYEESTESHPTRQSSPIRLESLRITNSDHVCNWLTNTPFDFSGLKALSLDHADLLGKNLLGSQQLVSAPPTIEILDLALTGSMNKPTIDLSSFPRLRHLRISDVSSETWPWMSAMLSTITSSTKISTIRIVIYYFLIDVAMEQLDLQLSQLPSSSTVEFSLQPYEYARIAPTLPRLCSKNMLRRVDDDRDWFQSLVGFA